MKIGRNEPCPCGSGKKYKKCCLKIGLNLNEIDGVIIPKSFSSDFKHIEPIAEKICNIIKKYNYEDVVKAIFCLNLWRRNRSALSQGLSLNMALNMCDSFGKKKIENYEEFKSFYIEISKYVKITVYEDFIVDDYGEVFINHKNKCYPVIIGTGYQLVYGVLRYLQTLASNTGHDNELIEILEYTESIITLTKDANIENINSEILYELPTELFWKSINNLFKAPEFINKFEIIDKLIGNEFGTIETQHFVKKEGKILPLYNSSILIDYYKKLLNTSTQEEKDKHIIDTIITLIDNTYNFSQNSTNRVLINPIVFDSSKKESFKYEEILFTGISDNTLLVVIKNNQNTDKIIEKIGEININSSIRLVEPFYRPENEGAIGIEVKSNIEIQYLLIDFFTDITTHKTFMEDKYNKVICTAIDLIYFIGFTKGINEIIEFIRYDINEKTKIISFGGVTNLFVSWMLNNRLLSSGAIEYDSLILDYNAAEDFIYSFFKENLCEFPRKGNLFIDPLNWNIENSKSSFKQIYHKGCYGFGGKIKRLDDSVCLFLGNNVELFSKADFSQKNHTVLNLVDELNEKLFIRYAKYITKLKILKEKTLEILFIPWEYACKNHINTFLNDDTRTLVYSDEYLDGDSIIIRYSVNPDILMSEIEKVFDRSVENTYLEELLKPLEKYSLDAYKMLKLKLDEDLSLKKTVSAFHFNQYYYYSDMSIDTNVSAIDFTKVRKEIAKVCFDSKIESGIYHGKNATSVIRKMQLSIVNKYENYIRSFDCIDLHRKILEYYSIQQNNIFVNEKRYNAFSNLDEEYQLEFEKETRSIREEYRRKAQTAKYLLESNLSTQHFDNAKVCSKDEFTFLIAFSDWHISLQEVADVAYHNDLDFSIEIDSEYKVNTLIDDNTLASYDEYLVRKYNVKDYSIKDDELDLEFFNKAIEAFNEDTKIDFKLLISFIEYMRLEVIEDNSAVEICPNVFEIDKNLLVQRFNEALNDPVENIDMIIKIISYLTLNPKLIKNINGCNHDILPIWEREKRENCFNNKPLLEFEGKYIFSPVAMNSVLKSWKSGLVEWYPPYEIGLPKLTSMLSKWKKRYEDEMVQDIAQQFRIAGFDFVDTEVDFARRFTNDGYPLELGDYDIIAINHDKNEIWIIESKVLQKVGSIYEDQMQQKRFFCKKKYDEKFQRRIDYMCNNTSKMVESLKIETKKYKIVPYMVTNKLFASRYKKIAFPIITFSEFKDLICCKGHSEQ